MPLIQKCPQALNKKFFTVISLTASATTRSGISFYSLRCALGQTRDTILSASGKVVMKGRIGIFAALSAVFALGIMVRFALPQGIATGSSVAVPSRPLPKGLTAPEIRFEDVGAAAGLTALNVSGAERNKQYIVEAVGFRRCHSRLRQRRTPGHFRREWREDLSWMRRRRTVIFTGTWARCGNLKT